MELSYNDILDTWKNFLRAGAGKLQFEEIMVKLNQTFLKHYHGIKYDSESMIYMKTLPTIAYRFTYDLILKDDKKFNQKKGGDIQIEIIVKMTNINTNDKHEMDVIDFMHKYCNPDCRAILEKGTIELL